MFARNTGRLRWIVLAVLLVALALATAALLAWTSPWDTQKRSTTVALYEQPGASTYLFSPDGTRILAVGGDGTGWIWDAGSGGLLHTLRGDGAPPHTAHASEGLFSPDGRRVLTVSADDTGRLWDTASGRLIYLRYNLPNASFSPDGKRIVSSDYEGGVGILDAARGGRWLHSMRAAVGSGYPVSTQFSPDGGLLATGNGDADQGSSRVWNVSTGHLLHVLHPASDAVFSPDGTRILTTAGTDGARIWDTASGRLLQVFRPAFSAVLSPDGARVLTVSEDGTARIWDAASGRTLRVLSRSARVYGDFSPDGTRVVTIQRPPPARPEESPARIWDVASGRSLLTLPATPVFSPDSKLVVAASQDGSAQIIWDVATGRQLHTLRPAISPVFSPDGTRLLTTSSDGRAQIWDTTSGRSLYTLRTS